MATGDSYISIAYNFRVGRQTVSCIVDNTCEAIWNNLVAKYMPVPDEEKWRNIANDFQEKWNFPNCLGAIDGKHVQVQSSAFSGSRYFNYKSFFSIVLMAISDANYRFIFLDVGDYGRNSDGGVFSHSSFGKALNAGDLALPTNKALPGTDVALPYVFVANAAFPAGIHLMRPYPGQYQLQISCCVALRCIACSGVPP